MKNAAKAVILLVILVAAAWVTAGCKSAEPQVKEVQVEVTRVVEKAVTVEVAKEVTRVVEQVVTKEVQVDPSGGVPFGTLWAGSGHADTEAEAFVHWDEDEPAEVPAGCAKCHSAYGYLDFLGLDGTVAGTVDNNAKIGSVINCVACHNTATVAMTSVVFPSGVEITGLGSEARCMQCHQGRASTKSVDDKIEAAGLNDEASLDTVSEKISFTNIHYFAAGATLQGGAALGGYQYTGKAYDSKLAHVEGYDTCVGCHDPHSLEVKVESCSTCHQDVNTVEDLKNVRMEGSLVDYDGDGDTKEGVFYEIDGLRTMLVQAMQAYSDEVAGAMIGYDPTSYPYFFVDANGNGEIDDDEANSDNRYAAFTPRLSKAVYNYQTSLKDPGAFAHGGKYIIELLYDSIEDLNVALNQPVDLSKASRIDSGHFAGSEGAFRHWDEEGEVPASCSKCHSAAGLPLYANQSVSISQHTASGFMCSTCHDSLTDYTRYKVSEVQFPSGSVVASESADSNLCMSCHLGRESTASVNKLIADIKDDEQSETLRFLNVHYFPAGATLYGTEAKGAYEFESETYVGRNAHIDTFNDCTECHNTHELTVRVDACGACHQDVKSVEDLSDIRMSTVDYDGDGDVSEGIAGEIGTMHDALYAAMQSYATGVAEGGIVYDSHSYPYFFADTNGNGQADSDEAVRANGYTAWTPRLLRAAYNYQYTAKDPGQFAHNPMYILQVLYDGLQDIGQGVTVDTRSMTRP